jgi:WD40 repeat protein
VTTVSKDRKIQSWDIRQADAIRTQDLAHEGEIWCIAAHESGTMFATSGTDRVIKIWDSASGRLLTQSPLVHSRPVAKIVFIPGTNRLVSVAEDGSLCCWSVA